MLGNRGMRTAFLAATGCLAISTTAFAGGYVGLALGTQPAINTSFEQTMAQPSGRSLRGLVGTRFGKVAVEGALNGFGVLSRRGAAHTAYQLSGALKLSLPLGNNFEGFARAGLERTWLNLDGVDLTGNGFLVGGGFEYRLDAILTSASVFVDYNVHRATLEAPGGAQVDETTRIWGLGLSVGI